MPPTDDNTYRSWVIADSVFSHLLDASVKRVLEEGDYSEEIRDFVELVSVPPWIMESIVNTAIVRWWHLLDSPEGLATAGSLASAYLEIGSFFSKSIRPEIRAGFALVVVETAARLMRQPHPAVAPWN